MGPRQSQTRSPPPPSLSLKTRPGAAEAHRHPEGSALACPGEPVPQAGMAPGQPQGRL